MSSEDAEKWQAAMEVETKARRWNGTWTLVDRSKDEKIITSKRVYAMKRNSESDVIKMKARLVSRGFGQTRGVDYNGTHSPVVKMFALQIHLALAAKR